MAKQVGPPPVDPTVWPAAAMVNREGRSLRSRGEAAEDPCPAVSGVPSPHRWCPIAVPTLAAPDGVLQVVTVCPVCSQWDFAEYTRVAR